MTRRESAVFWLPAAVIYIYLAGFAFDGASPLMRTIGAAFLAVSLQVLGLFAYSLFATARDTLLGEKTRDASRHFVSEAAAPALMLAVVVWIAGQVAVRGTVERISDCVDQASRELMDDGPLPKRVVWSCYREPDPGFGKREPARTDWHVATR